ncbi:hypothetical protein [Lactococcus phage P1048]|uniref:Uncharacterized protein n=1 Tax=Lactococcus phage P1048 TaxID=2662295 RepID=A0A649V2D8_9CAUD|nr:hypothetical protein H1Z36_gp124 [Lactococcus phage P1048]QGJ85004.1 hypothetical protein [Lactococcus phage P1048]
MEAIDVEFTIGVDDYLDEKFRLLEMNCYYDFDISRKLEMLDAIRKGLIEEEICKVTNIINTLHHSTHSSGELTKLIETQTKLLERLKNNGN